MGATKRKVKKQSRPPPVAQQATSPSIAPTTQSRPLATARSSLFFFKAFLLVILVSFGVLVGLLRWQAWRTSTETTNSSLQGSSDDLMYLRSLLPYAEYIQVPYATYKELFSPKECQQIIDTFIAKHGDELRTEEFRTSKNAWVPSDEMDWVYKRMAAKVQEVNKEVFHVSGVRTDYKYKGEQIQFAQYHENRNGSYNWHIDNGPGEYFGRRISFTVQLSPGTDYEGGELQLVLRNPYMDWLEKLRTFLRWSGLPLISSLVSADTVPIPVHVGDQSQGTATVFQSETYHRVSPVTKGTRYSLVGWYRAPPDGINRDWTSKFMTTAEQQRWLK